MTIVEFLEPRVGIPERVDWTLEQFNNEILNLPVVAPTLPAHLPDVWLDRLLLASEIHFEDEQHPDFPAASATFTGALTNLLAARNGGFSMVSVDVLVGLLPLYQIELTIEEIARKTSVPVNRATLSNILTNRFLTAGLPEIPVNETYADRREALCWS